MTDRIRQLILQRADAGMLAKAAAAEGMGSMFEDGLRKALAGDTSIDEVLRVTQDSRQ
jgi:general secretion pathway protein E